MSLLLLVTVPKPSRPVLMSTPTRRGCEAMFLNILPLLSYWPQFCALCFHPSTSPLLVCFASCKRLRMWTRTTSRVVPTCFCQPIFYMALCGSRDLAVTPSLLRAAHVLGVCLTCLRVLVNWMLNACMPHASGRGRASSLWASVLRILHPWIPAWPHGWMTWGSSCRPNEIARGLV